MYHGSLTLFMKQSYDLGIMLSKLCALRLLPFILASACGGSNTPIGTAVVVPPSTSGITGLGDSLTAGNQDADGMSWPHSVSLLGGINVKNRGIVGQSSTQIAARAGAMATTVSVSGGLIPTSACAVTATFPSHLEPAYLVTATTPYLDGNGVSITGATVDGSIAGVAGSLQDNGSQVYTFTPTFCPSGAVIVPPNTAWVPASTTDYDGALVIWAGRNDVSNAISIFTIEAAIAAIVAWHSPKPYIVIGIANAEGESYGTSNYNQIVALNHALASTYGDKYVDIRSLLVAEFDPGIGPDVVDHGNDVIPYSMRATYGPASQFVLTSAIDNMTCNFTAAPTAPGLMTNDVIKIDSEYILITSASGQTATECVRGYGSAAAPHALDTEYSGTDIMHLNYAGYYFVGQQIENALLSGK